MNTLFLMLTLIFISDGQADEKLEFKVQDQVFAAYYGKNTSETGVIFVPSQGHDHSQWAYLAEYLSNNQHSSITLDLLEFKPSNFPIMHHQILQSADFLVNAGIKSLTCVGVDFSASLCAQAAVRHPNINRVAMVSPDMLSHGITLENHISDDIEYYIIVEDSDRYSQKSIDRLGDRKNMTVNSIPSSPMVPQQLTMGITRDTELLRWLLIEPPPLKEAPKLIIHPLIENHKIETKGDELPW
jgi:hypothetical protein